MPLLIALVVVIRVRHSASPFITKGVFNDRGMKGNDETPSEHKNERKC